MSILAERLPSALGFAFDFYGTLVVDDPSAPAMWKELVRLGYPATAELEAIFEPNAFDGCVTPDCRSTPSHDEWNRANWLEFVRLSGVPAREVDAALEALFAAQHRYHAYADPVAAPLIDSLRRYGFRVGLCSNWESPIEPYLAQAQLRAFDAVSISAEVGARKPHAAMFADVCAKLDLAPAEVVFVGDSWRADIAGALRAGLTPVWIHGRHAPRRLPHIVQEFATLADLHEWLNVTLPHIRAA